MKYSGEYDSAYSDSDTELARKKKFKDFYENKVSSYGESSSSSSFPAEASAVRSKQSYECGADEYRKYFASFNAFDRHKILINQYLLYHPGATLLLKRDKSRDKRDADVLRENHQFLWEDNAAIQSWGKKLAKKYYDKLFKEYCICDLSRYKDGQIGMRWRVETEVVDGKGQFSCSTKGCSVKENIRTWEMNFGYVEDGAKKNVLVKLRLCHDCSYKLNFKTKRKEVKRAKSKKGKEKKSKTKVKKTQEEIKEEGEGEEAEEGEEKKEETNIWKEPAKITEEKDREEEFEEYLQDLFL